MKNVQTRFVQVTVLLICWAGFPAFAQICDESAQNECEPPEFCTPYSNYAGRPTLTRDFPICVARISPEVIANGCVNGREPSLGVCQFRWDGPISMRGVAVLEEAIRNTDSIKHGDGSANMIFQITSDGGDVYAAMRLGRLLRSNKAKVWAVNYCASACVLVLAGGVDRFSEYENVVIHRPYDTAVGGIGMQERQKLLKARNQDIRDYLSEMNVPTELLNEMLAVPAHEGRRLSNDELKYFMLHGGDPAWEEDENAKEASEMGISIAEFLRRRQEREQCLSDINDVRFCFDAFFNTN